MSFNILFPELSLVEPDARAYSFDAETNTIAGRQSVCMASGLLLRKCRLIELATGSA